MFARLVAAFLAESKTTIVKGVLTFIGKYSNLYMLCQYGVFSSVLNLKGFARKGSNGLRYLRVGGRGQCLRAGKTRSQKNA